MTAAGTRRHDATGRSTGRLKSGKYTRIEGQFVGLRLSLLESPAWGAVSLAGRRALDRLMLEHLNHGGMENGKLVCTYDDFAAFGIRRKSVAPAIRELIALGFLVVTQRGRMAAAEFHTPNTYRLTYLSEMGGRGPATDDWERLSADDVAAAIARLKEQKSGGGNAPVPGAEMPLCHGPSGGENAPTAPGAETPPLSIFCRQTPGGNEQDASERAPQSAVANERLAGRTLRLVE